MGDVVDGRYRILKVLGEGGMGTVFLAEHALIKRRVALKVLHPELAQHADVIERFMNEARAAGTLGHPNIAESTDMGFTRDHVPYIVFEYLEGTLLTDEIYRVGGFTVRRAVRIAQQIASALHAAHTAHIIHRDLKSENVFLVDKDGTSDHVKVIDFGISRFLEADDDLTRPGTMLGTPEFMAPEQITGARADRRTDVYALGVILYEMLTARQPFVPGKTPSDLLTQVVYGAPPPLDRDDVPPALSDMILEQMLAKAPGDRFATMFDVEVALDAFVDHAEAGGLRRSYPVIPKPSSVDEPAKAILDTSDRLAAARPTPAPTVSRPWWLYAIAGAGVATGVAGLAIGGLGEPRAELPAPPPAARAASHKVALQVEASAPGARVTFRGRAVSAPAVLEVAASDVVEIVEVAAPGYRTERYWLTLDRPIHLTAQLVAGDGLREAALTAPVAPAAKPVDGDALSSLVGTHSGDVEHCAEARRVDPATTSSTLAGSILVVLSIGADGRVVDAQTETALDAPQLIDCVIAAAKQWTFPAHSGSGLATVSFPFTVR